MFTSNSMVKRKLPSLVDLCVFTAIDNLRYLGDVGGMDLYLLERILPHCTVDQLRHIEKCSEGTDLSPVTDKLWKKFYEKEFGIANAKLVVERMEKRNIRHKWIKLYEAKKKEMDEAQNEATDRIAKRYKEADALKQSRQVRLCTKVPPGSKRSFWGGGGPGYNVSNGKSNIMKKAKIDFLKSNECLSNDEARCREGCSFNFQTHQPCCKKILEASFQTYDIAAKTATFHSKSRVCKVSQ